MAGLGNNTNKIVAMLGLAAVVFVGVTWFLPKVERHQGQVFGHSVEEFYPPVTHVATGQAATDQSMTGVRDFNLAGLAIEDQTHMSGI